MITISYAPPGLNKILLEIKQCRNMEYSAEDLAFEKFKRLDELLQVIYYSGYIHSKSKIELGAVLDLIHDNIIVLQLLKPKFKTNNFLAAAIYIFLQKAKKYFIEKTEVNDYIEPITATITTVISRVFLHEIKAKLTQIYPPSPEKACMQENRFLRIALIGETSSGKTALLNAIFKTNFFFVTQEEATGIPTEIYYGYPMRVEVLDQDNIIRQKFLIKPTYFSDKNEMFLKDAYLSKVKDFLIRYTKAGSPDSSWVKVVKVYMPLKLLPKHIVLIDTPGFNASEKSSNLARQVIKNSHACMFVIDARFPLKANEMQILQTVRHEFGKAFIILNKMDLISGNDTFDCDSDNSVDLVINRVRRELAKSFQVNDIIVYPVCTLPREKVGPDSKRFINNLYSLIDHLSNEAITKHQYLLLQYLAKKVTRLSEPLINLLQTAINDYKFKLESVHRIAPMDFAVAEGEIRKHLRDCLKQHIRIYVDHMTRRLNSELILLTSRFFKHLNSISDKDDLKTFVERSFENRFNTLIASICSFRRNELYLMFRHVNRDLAKIISGFYQNLSFDLSFDVNTLLKDLPDIVGPVANNSSLKNISNEDSISYGGAAVGALIGSIAIGPAGFFLGGIIGSLFGGRSIEDIKNEIKQVFQEAVFKVRIHIAAVIKWDLNQFNQSSAFSRLNLALEQQLNFYRNEVDLEAKKYVARCKALADEMKIFSDSSAEIIEIIKYLADWRKKVNPYIS